MASRPQNIIAPLIAGGGGGMMFASDQFGWNWPYGIVLLVAILSVGAFAWAAIIWRPAANRWFVSKHISLPIIGNEKIFNGLTVVSAIFVIVYIAISNEPISSPLIQSANSYNSKLELMGQSEGTTAGGKSMIGRLFRISGSPPLYSVTFKAHGPGFIDLRVKQRDWRRTEFMADEKIRDGRAITVNEPRGLYDIQVIAEKNANAINFGYECKSAG